MKLKHTLKILFALLLIVTLIGCRSPVAQPETVNIVTFEDAFIIETFELSDLVFDVSYDDGTEGQISVTQSMISSADLAKLSTVGRHHITVTYLSFEIELEVMMVNQGFVLIVFDDPLDLNFANQVIPINSRISLPSTPSVNNYFFVDFYLESDYLTKFDDSELLTRSLILYVRYLPDTNESLVTLDIEDLRSMEGMSVSGERLILPTTGPYGSRYVWTSSNLELITHRGYIIPPALTARNARLNASVRNDGFTKTGRVNVSVLPRTPLATVTSSKDLPFENITSEYDVANGQLKTYFLNDSNIPFVDVKEFFYLLNGVIESDNIEFLYSNNVLTITYSIEYSEDDLLEDPTLESVTYEARLDFNAQTITVDSLSFFGGYVKSTATDYSEGLTYLETYYEQGSGVTFNLAKYRQDMLIHEDSSTKFLMPFHLVNALFIGTSYYNVYYNGDAYYGIYGVPSNADSATGEARAAYNKIKTSTLNGTAIPHDMALHTYHVLAFVMDHLYGLKNDMGVVTFYDVLKDYSNDMVSADTRRLTTGVSDFLRLYLDELHTGHRFPGYYESVSYSNAPTSYAQFYNGLGPNVKSWYDVLSNVQTVIASKYPTTRIPPNFRFIDNGNIAVIYLDGFHTATVEDPTGKDSNRYMRETLDAIFAERPNVKNIVIDLSYNTGGNLGALLRVLGFITEKPIEMHYINPTENTRTSYFIEVETKAYDKINWFFLSSKVSFSAANLMLSIGKEQGLATIIGTKSGGGASSITPIILPNGTFFTMSSTNVLAYRTGSDATSWTYHSIENGVEPHYIISVNDLHNDDVIASVVNQAN